MIAIECLFSAYSCALFALIVLRRKGNGDAHQGKKDFLMKDFLKKE